VALEERNGPEWKGIQFILYVASVTTSLSIRRYGTTLLDTVGLLYVFYYWLNFIVTSSIDEEKEFMLEALETLNNVTLSRRPFL
jgi:hypothetical protein